jgi:hypothetical protein
VPFRSPSIQARLFTFTTQLQRWITIMAEQKIEAAHAELSKLNITFRTITHAAAATADEHKALVGAQLGDTVLAKNLFLRDKNKKLLLAVVANERKIDMKKFGTFLVCLLFRFCPLFPQVQCFSGILQGVGTSGVRFADSETMTSVLTMQQGHVTPLAIVFDTQHQVTVLLDKTLAESACIVRYLSCCCNFKNDI